MTTPRESLPVERDALAQHIYAEARSQGDLLHGWELAGPGSRGFAYDLADLILAAIRSARGEERAACAKLLYDKAARAYAVANCCLGSEASREFEAKGETLDGLAVDIETREDFPPGSEERALPPSPPASLESSSSAGTAQVDHRGCETGDVVGVRPAPLNRPAGSSDGGSSCGITIKTVPLSGADERALRIPPIPSPTPACPTATQAAPPPAGKDARSEGGAS